MGMYEQGYRDGLGVHGPDADGCTIDEEATAYEAGYRDGVADRTLDPTFAKRLIAWARFCGESGWPPKPHGCESPAEHALYQEHHAAGRALRDGWSPEYRKGRDAACRHIDPFGKDDFSRGFLETLLERGQDRRLSRRAAQVAETLLTARPRPGGPVGDHNAEVLAAIANIVHPRCGQKEAAGVEPVRASITVGDEN